MADLDMLSRIDPGRVYRILVGCETSGVVRRAFAARGHDVWSVDLLPAEDGSNRHIVGDIRDHLDGGWDLLAVMHPPCTRHGGAMEPDGSRCSGGRRVTELVLTSPASPARPRVRYGGRNP